MLELADRMVGISRASCSATRAARAPGERRQGLPRRQPEPPLPDHHQGAQRTRLRARRSRSTRACAARWSGTPATAKRAERLMRISIIGTGYVGLVTGACLAEKGHQVVCVDVDAARVDALNRARAADLRRRASPELLTKHVGHAPDGDDRPRDRGAGEADVTLIAVGTPFDGQRDRPHASCSSAAAQIGAALRDKPRYHLVVVKSTVVPGTTDSRVLPALEAASGKQAGADFGVGMNPEFLSEGEAVKRLHVSRPHRARRHRRALDRRARAGLRALPRRDAPLAHQPAHGGDDQVRLERAARDADLVLATSSRTSAPRSADIDTVDVMRGVHLSQYLRGRNARRPAADHVFPEGRLRLRRQLLSEGREGARGPRRARRRRRCRCSSRCWRSTSGSRASRSSC